MMNPTTSTATFFNAQGQGDYYAMEHILKKKIAGGKLLYLIKWNGYPNSCNTWEPAENIDSREIEKFESEKQHDEFSTVPVYVPTFKSSTVPIELNGIDKIIGMTWKDDAKESTKYCVVVLKDDKSLRKIKYEAMKKSYPQELIAFFEANIKWDHQ